MSGGKGGGQRYVSGYRYYFNIHMGIGRGPVDELVEAKVADRTVWQGSVSTNAEVTVSAPNAFGGESKEGGIEGKMQVLMGGGAQTAPSLLRKLFGADVPLSINISGMPAGNGVYVRNVSTVQNDEGLATERVAYLLSVGSVQYTIDQDVSKRWQIYGGTIFYRSVGPEVNSPELVSSWVRVTVTQGGYDYETGSFTTVETETAAPGLSVTANYTRVPSFRRMFTIVFDGMIGANNPYPKAWKFKVRRTNAGWDGGVWQPSLCAIMIGPIKAMNPAHIIYECLTNREWGRGLPRAALDDAAFLSCAQVLYSEGFGLCLRWNRTDSIEAFIKGILDHIGANLFTSRRTGLQTLRLVRGNYDINTLPHFNPDNGLLEISDAPIASSGVAINEVQVKYRDPISDEDRTVQVSNLAALQASGGQINSTTRDYPGVVNATWATLLAQRDLRLSSMALRKFTIKLDRRGRNIEPGEVFLISDPKRGIPITPVRAGGIEDGTLTDGAIKITALQDVFALPIVPWQVDVPNQWQRPNTQPCIDVHRAFEVPYFMLVANLSRADLDYVQPTDGYLGTVCARGKSLNIGYRIAVRSGAATPDDQPVSQEFFCSIN